MNVWKRLRLFALIAATLFCFTAAGGATSAAPCVATLAPAAAPTTATDSLPAGRHVVSTYRNGSSTRLVVEDRAIQTLEIDGEAIPPSEYEQHLPMVYEMLGVSDQPNDFLHDDSQPDWLDKDQFKDRLKSYEERFEHIDENWEYLSNIFERVAERFSKEFEAMLDLSNDENDFRLEFKGDGEGHFLLDVDSLPAGANKRFPLQTMPSDRQGGSWYFDGQEYRSLDDDNPAKDAEAEIREMETMIEKLERRKAELRRQQNESVRTPKAPAPPSGIDLPTPPAPPAAPDVDVAGILQSLAEEGVIDMKGKFRSLVFANDRLAVNGKKQSEEALRKFTQRYEAATGKPLSGDFEVRIKQR